MQVHHEVVKSTPSVTTDRTDTTTYDPNAARRAMSVKLTQTIYFIVGLIEALLVIRFALKAMGANAEAGFAQFVYSLTAPLVAPFVGLFGTPQATGGTILELHTLIALVFYVFLAWLLVSGARLLFGDGRSANTARTDTQRTVIR